jgi:chemotaxis methyl-accepting protein methylase
LNDESALDAILAIVRGRTGFDFTAYRRATIHRRVRNRMLGVGSTTVGEYLGLLEGDEHETSRLLDRLTIKVSRFYRDANVFDRLRTVVLPELARAARGRALRLWSAGCGRGEEAHTLAMLLEEAEAPGTVVATDIDAGALAQASVGLYPESATTELPAELRERFLVPVGAQPAPVAAKRAPVAVAPEVRRRIEWRIDDLAAAAGPAPPYDLVCCRNVLIYLDRPTQARAMRRLVSSMARPGYLVLGEAEWPSPEVLPFLESVAHRQRIFRARIAEKATA